MTLRYKIGCTICNQKYLMRISVGHSEKQSHIIECNECKTNMSLELLVNFQKVSSTLNCIDNCEKIDFVDHGFESNGEYSVAGWKFSRHWQFDFDDLFDLLSSL
jgi:transcription elongation factor Elf1